MNDSAEWLRNLARNYADGVPGMSPEDHPAWEIADEIERLHAQWHDSDPEKLYIENRMLRAERDGLMVALKALERQVYKLSDEWGREALQQARAVIAKVEDK
jgi:hypothetical protein